MKKPMLYVALLLLFVPAVFAQQGVSVQGIVSNKGNGEAVWGANVELRKEGDSAASYGAVTGEDGRFTFPSVRAGSYQLLATAQGHVPAEYGQKRMKGAGLPFIVEAGKAVSGVRVEMTPTGAISGRVIDPAGQPIMIADVFVLKSSYQEGQRILTQVLSAKTDERGEFR